MSSSHQTIGTEAAPFKTLLHAVTAARAYAGPNTVVMRNGTHFLNQTIQFTPEDNGLTIQVCQACWPMFVALNF